MKPGMRQAGNRKNSGRRTNAVFAASCAGEAAAVGDWRRAQHGPGCVRHASRSRKCPRLAGISSSSRPNPNFIEANTPARAPAGGGMCDMLPEPAGGVQARGFINGNGCPRRSADLARRRVQANACRELPNAPAGFQRLGRERPLARFRTHGAGALNADPRRPLLRMADVVERL